MVYIPIYKQSGNHVETFLPSRYDAFLFIDRRNALHPLHMPVSGDKGLPETFRTGLSVVLHSRCLERHFSDVANNYAIIGS